MPCTFACTLLSVRLVSVVFGTAIYILYIPLSSILCCTRVLRTKDVVLAF